MPSPPLFPHLQVLDAADEAEAALLQSEALVGQVCRGGRGGGRCVQGGRCAGIGSVHIVSQG